MEDTRRNKRIVTEDTRRIVTEDTRQKRWIVMKDTRRLSRKTLDETNGLSQKTPDGLSPSNNSRQIQIVTGFTRKIYLHNKKQIVPQQGSSWAIGQGSSWAIGQCIKFRFQSDSGDGDVSE